MKEQKERQITSKHIFKGKLLDVYSDKVLLPDGKTAIREYIKHPGAVIILPVLPDGRILLIKQFRYSIGELELELPAGKIDPGESPQTTAGRELEEETGYVAGDISQLAEIHPCIGYSNERLWLFMAENITKTKSNAEYDEFIRLMPTPLSKAVNMVWSGEIKDVKAIIGVLWAEKLLSK